MRREYRANVLGATIGVVVEPQPLALAVLAYMLCEGGYQWWAIAAALLCNGSVRIE